MHVRTAHNTEPVAQLADNVGQEHLGGPSPQAVGPIRRSEQREEGSKEELRSLGWQVEGFGLFRGGHRRLRQPGWTAGGCVGEGPDLRPFFQGLERTGDSGGRGDGRILGLGAV